MVMWHIKLKGMNSSPGCTENILHYNQTGDLGMGLKGQLPLDFFESVGICNGAPSNVFCFLFWNPLAGEDSFVDLEYLPFNVMWLLNFVCFPHGAYRALGAVCNVFDCRSVSDCRSRGSYFDPSMVPYFHGYWSWNNFHGHSSAQSWRVVESCKQKYVYKVLVNCLVKLAQERESVVR